MRHYGHTCVWYAPPVIKFSTVNHNAIKNFKPLLIGTLGSLKVFKAFKIFRYVFILALSEQQRDNLFGIFK
jgi:hypothetical protein